MDVFWPWFLIAQAAAFPSLATGSEVRLVSPDLLEVHASGRVEAGALALQGGPLPVGSEVRVLVFPADADDDEVAAAASGAAAISARIAEDEVWILADDGGDARSLRELLADQGIVLTLPGASEP